jgi:hypothetical protein
MTMNGTPLSVMLLAAILAIAPGRTVAQAQPGVFPVEEASISDLTAAYIAGTATARVVTQAHLDRIAAYEKRGPFINSLITINPRALEDADRLDAALAASGRLVGPLHGIPIVVKDNIDVAGLPMTSGFQGWKNYHPPADAPVVKRLREAGAIILAKSSLSEFTRGIGDNINSVLPGFARNPFNTAFATGGSSGGTGASVAASFAVAGIGTDTGGSVRAPSAHNALAGLRPTVGLVSTAGMTPNNSVRDTTGPMARSVRDMTILLDVIAGPDPADPVTARAEGHRLPSYAGALRPDALKGARLGVLRQVFGPAVSNRRFQARAPSAPGLVRRGRGGEAPGGGRRHHRGPHERAALSAGLSGGDGCGADRRADLSGLGAASRRQRRPQLADHRRAQAGIRCRAYGVEQRADLRGERAAVAGDFRAQRLPRSGIAAGTADCRTPLGRGEDHRLRLRL